ncbi:hypothetical protein [Clostridium psychrophilum]|nr:hypothetical protein [Clostridium psychrophilum]MBU3182732.1 hypothetical protein [Clostridium psychrophilum]
MTNIGIIDNPPSSKPIRDILFSFSKIEITVIIMDRALEFKNCFFRI